MSTEPRLQIKLSADIATAKAQFLDWMRYEFGIIDAPAKLIKSLDSGVDAVVGALRSTPPKTNLSAAEIARLKKEYSELIEPAHLYAAHALGLERQVSSLVNAAYGLTAEEVALMWGTAPPRMPFTTTNTR